MQKSAEMEVQRARVFELILAGKLVRKRCCSWLAEQSFCEGLVDVKWVVGN